MVQHPPQGPAEAILGAFDGSLTHTGANTHPVEEQAAARRALHHAKPNGARTALGAFVLEPEGAKVEAGFAVLLHRAG